MALFLVLMPKYEEEKEGKVPRNEKEWIAQMEQIYGDFLSIRKQGFLKRIMEGLPRITFEIASQVGGSDIEFYAAVPKNLETAFEKYIQGVYPKAVIQKVPQDYTIFEPENVTMGAWLRLRSSPLFPISTYRNLEKDPLATLTNTLSKIAPDEGAAVQLIISPFLQSKNWKGGGSEALRKIQEGVPAESAAREAVPSSLFQEIRKTIFVKAPQQKERQEATPWRGSSIDQRSIEAIQNKIQKHIFDSNIRLVVSAKTKQRAEEIFQHLIGAFGQFSVASFNGFEIVEAKGRRLKKLIYDFSFRNFHSAQSIALNIEELTSIFHFPTPSMETPYVKMTKVGTAAAPPAELPEKGLNVIGKVVFRGEEKEVAFAAREDRRRHFYIIGQTGTGKSSLLREMIRQDVENGEGVGVIDPHGELIEATLANIPNERMEDVVLFEPFDLERPMGLNMLEYESPEQKDFAVQEMIAIFHKLFPPEIIGPMFEHYMRNAMLALMADKTNPGTLVEIPRMFTDSEFMEQRLQKVEDSMVRSFWLKEWKQTTGSTRSDMLGYVVSKIGRFIENEMMRNIIGQTHSAFDLGVIMDKKKIFLANLSKGLTGEVNSALLGLILVSKMQMAAMRRARIPEETRQDFYLYIDEFQNFSTDSIVTILSEARKYRLNLIMAHQYIPQLTEEIRHAVLGNVGTMGVFRIGAQDAEFLEAQFKPEFSRFDLVNLDNFHLLVKMLIQGKLSSSFEMQTVKPEIGSLERVEGAKKNSSSKYGRPKELVEMEIFERSKLE